METPSKTQTINADEIVAKVPSQTSAVEASKTKKRPAKTAKSSTKKTSSLTDEQKRLARNAALREWRKKNAGRVKAYMTEWRAKREGKQPEKPKQRPNNGKQRSVQPASSKTTKRTTSKKPKKGGKA